MSKRSADAVSSMRAIIFHTGDPLLGEVIQTLATWEDMETTLVVRESDWETVCSGDAPFGRSRTLTITDKSKSGAVIWSGRILEVIRGTKHDLLHACGLRPDDVLYLAVVSKQSESEWLTRARSRLERTKEYWRLFTSSVLAGRLGYDFPHVFLVDDNKASSIGSVATRGMTSGLRKALVESKVWHRPAERLDAGAKAPPEAPPPAA